MEVLRLYLQLRNKSVDILGGYMYSIDNDAMHDKSPFFQAYEI